MPKAGAQPPLTVGERPAKPCATPAGSDGMCAGAGCGPPQRPVRLIVRRGTYRRGDRKPLCGDVSWRVTSKAAAHVQ